MTDKKPFPLALPVPEGEIVTLDHQLLQEAIEMSRRSPRKRVILPLHKSDNANLHRMFNVLQPGTYIRPHWHNHPPKDEAIVVLQGKIVVFIFEDDGQVRQVIELESGTPNFGIDMLTGVCHTFLVLAPDTVLYEIKPGPYVRATDKDFAPWAPAEGEDSVADYLASLESFVLP